MPSNRSSAARLCSPCPWSAKWSPVVLSIARAASAEESLCPPTLLLSGPLRQCGASRPDRGGGLDAGSGTSGAGLDLFAGEAQIPACPMGSSSAAAEDVLSRSLFDRIVAGSEIRYFSDIFRYAALYEHGGLWMDSDVILLRPFPVPGRSFPQSAMARRAMSDISSAAMSSMREPHSRHLRTLYEMSIDRFFGSSERIFGEVGPMLLSDYVASPAGAELRDSAVQPDVLQSHRLDGGRPVRPAARRSGGLSE